MDVADIKIYKLKERRHFCNYSHMDVTSCSFSQHNQHGSNITGIICFTQWRVREGQVEFLGPSYNVEEDQDSS